MGVVFSKKGVSPLIATILLIAFAVALGSVVMNWGLNLDLGGDDICKNVEIRIRNVGPSDACFGGFGQGGYINFVLDNTGSVDINGLAIWAIGEKGISLFDIDNVVIKRGSLYEKEDEEVSYDFSKYGNIKQIQFVPKVRSGQSAEVCPKNSIKAEKIGVCS